MCILLRRQHQPQPIRIKKKILLTFLKKLAAVTVIIVNQQKKHVDFVM